MVSSSQIKAELARALDGRISLDAFEDWFVHNTWNIHLSGSVAAEALTFAIEESFSEYSSKHISEQELRRELLQILQADNQIAEMADLHQPVYRFRSSAPVVFAPVRV